jgi:Transposase, Mutator family
LIEDLIRNELDAVLSRPRHGRRPMDADGADVATGAAGHRHGNRTRTLMGTFGKTEIAVPRARLTTSDGETTDWKSQALRAYHRRTLAADALIASSYLAGTNTRRVRRALAALFGGAVGKDTVSRVWRKVKSVSFLAQTLEDLLSAIRVGVEQPRDARLERIKHTAARPAAPRLEARSRHPRGDRLRIKPQRAGGLRDCQALAIMAVVDLAERLVIDHGDHAALVVSTAEPMGWAIETSCNAGPTRRPWRQYPGWHDRHAWTRATFTAPRK